MRSERSRCIAVLQGWHFHRVPDPDPEFAMTWEGPLGRTVRLMGTEAAPRVTVKRGEEIMDKLFDEIVTADVLDLILER